MKINEIDAQKACSYLKEEYTELDAIEITMINMMISAAINYIKSYTGLTIEQMNELDDLTIVFLVLLQDFYDNRSFSNDKQTYANKVVDNILKMYSRNLIGVIDSVV